MQVNKKFIVIFGVLFIASLALNYFIFCGKGIVINQDRRATYHQEQYQQQWSGQLIMNMWAAQGNTAVWRYKAIKDFKSIDELVAFKQALHPLSSWFSRVEPIPTGFKYGEYDWYLLWPDIFTEKK